MISVIIHALTSIVSSLPFFMKKEHYLYLHLITSKYDIFEYTYYMHILIHIGLSLD